MDYINTHGTSTPRGDITELEAIGKVFGENIPPISSTKSLTGHSLGAAGVQELIYALLMQRHGFIAASANIENLDPEAGPYPIVHPDPVEADIKTFMSNSFGFGGANATLVVQRYEPD